MKRLRLRIARAFAEVTSLVILVTACGAQDSAAIPLRVAVLPILDSLPLYVAQEEGFSQTKDLTWSWC